MLSGLCLNVKADCVLCNKVWVVSVCAVTVSSCEAGADTEANCLPWLLFLYLYLFLYSYLYFKCLTYCEELQEDLSSLTSVTIKPMLEKFLISLGRNRWYDMNNFPNPIHFLYFSLFQINALREPSTRETSDWFWRPDLLSSCSFHRTGRPAQGVISEERS